MLSCHEGDLDSFDRKAAILLELEFKIIKVVHSWA